SIESIWNKAKLYLRKVQGISRVYLQSYFDQFTWVQNKSLTRVGTFSAILDTISKVYPANKLQLKENLNSELDLDFEKESGDLIRVEEGEEIDKTDVEDGNISDFVDCNKTRFEENADIDVPFISNLNLENFKESVHMILKNIDNNFYLRFSNSLSIDQRKIVYEICKLYNILFQERGTRYKVIYVFKNSSPDKISDKADDMFKNMARLEISRDNHVEDVLDQEKLKKSIKKNKLDINCN
ncbi:unnamed protein product, partial [Brachionus calyciflorus]